MALAGCAPACGGRGGGATLAQMLDFLSRGRNQLFQTIYEFIILYSDIVDHLEK